MSIVNENPTISVIDDYSSDENIEKHYEDLFERMKNNYCDKFEDLSEISLNYQYYYPNESKLNVKCKILKTEKRKALIKQIYIFHKRTDNINSYFFTGPVGIGKSITLLYYQKAYRSLKVCYFQLKLLIELLETKNMYTLQLFF